MRLKRLAIAIIVTGAPVISTPIWAQQPTGTSEIKTVDSGDIKYKPLPFAPGAETAYLASDGKAPENYTIRVRLRTDAKIPPHTHPDARMITVLSGDLFIGAGAKFDPDNATAIRTGGFFVMPAGLVHWSWAKSGEVVYQETGTGPTATTMVK